MDIETVRHEAEALRRPAQFLVPGDDDIAAYWHGLATPDRCLVVRYNDHWLEIGIDSAQEIDAPVESSTPLIAVPQTVLPPIDAVFALGSDAVGERLCSCKWERDWGFNDNFADSKIVYEYEAEWQQSFPLYTQSAHAVLGGWHFPWPDDDWHGLLDDELVVWTLAEAEPWIEVWKCSGVFVVKERIT